MNKVARPYRQDKPHIFLLHDGAWRVVTMRSKREKCSTLNRHMLALSFVVKLNQNNNVYALHG